jgi:hypothetical protein
MIAITRDSIPIILEVKDLTDELLAKCYSPLTNFLSSIIAKALYT